MTIQRSEVEALPTMLCHECRKQMTRREDGAWIACCGNLGYWIDSATVLPKDRWYPAMQRNELTFCPSPRWTASNTKNPPNPPTQKETP